MVLIQIHSVVQMRDAMRVFSLVCPILTACDENASGIGFSCFLNGPALYSLK